MSSITGWDHARWRMVAVVGVVFIILLFFSFADPSANTTSRMMGSSTTTETETPQQDQVATTVVTGRRKEENPTRRASGPEVDSELVDPIEDNSRKATRKMQTPNPPTNSSSKVKRRGKGGDASTSGGMAVPFLPPFLAEDDKRKRAIASTTPHFPVDTLLNAAGAMPTLERVIAEQRVEKADEKLLIEQQSITLTMMMTRCKAKPFAYDGTMQYLNTEKFYTKYGLTNLMMTVAAMMAYGAESNRAIIFPERTPILIDSLFDLDLTQQLLLCANVVLVPGALGKKIPQLLKEGQPGPNSPGQKGKYHPFKVIKARSRNENLGYRKHLSSELLEEAEFGYTRMRESMDRLQDATYLVQRDFFLRFPFRVTAPLDVCYYMRRLVFHPGVLDRAQRTMQWLQTKAPPLSAGRSHQGAAGGGNAQARSRTTVMAVHLRLEWDIKLLVKRAAEITENELERWLRVSVLPLAEHLRIDLLYVCAGSLKEDYMRAIKRVSSKRLPIYTKADVPFLSSLLSSQEAETLPPEKAKPNKWTTSHSLAAMDVTIMQHASATIVFAGSTLPLAVLSKRCPTDHTQLGLVQSALRKRMNTSSLLQEGETSTTTLGPGKKTSHHTTSASTSMSPEDRAAHGVFGYRFDIAKGSATTVRMGDIHFLPCDAPYMAQCFYKDVK